MRIGAHVSTAGGADKAIDRAKEMGCQTIQIFGASPQSWRRKDYQQAEVDAFRTKTEEADIQPIFLHGVYLINLATSNPDNLEKAVGALIHDLHISHLLGAKGVIFHLGSHRGAGFASVLPQIVDSLQRILAQSPEETWLILENSAGMGDAVGSRFAELATIMGQVGSPRVKICLDTQHMFASGYDVKTPEGLRAAMEEFEREIGLPHLVAVHANDSKCPLAGGVDRHENIGHGYIGRDGFTNILSYPAFQELPFLLEVPGFANQGPDKENVDILVALAQAARRG